MLHPAVNQLPKHLAFLASEITLLGQEISLVSYRKWWSLRWGLLSRWEAVKLMLHNCADDYNALGEVTGSFLGGRSLHDHLNCLSLDLYGCLEILAAKENFMCYIFSECIVAYRAFLFLFWQWGSFSLVSSVRMSCSFGSKTCSRCFSWKLNKCGYEIG